MQQQTQEWHEFRQLHIGSSDAAAIMGVSPWKTRHKLWEEKRGLLPPSPKTYAMDHGIRMEEEARRAYEKLTGTIVFPEVIVHPEHSWMSASLDGIDITGKMAVEIKCPLGADHQEAVEGRVPLKYYPQCQHILAVTGADVLHYFSFQNGNGVLVEMGIDHDYIAELISQERAFWELVITGMEPERTDKDGLECSDSVWLDTATQWAAVQKRLKELQEQEAFLKEQLIEMAPASHVWGGGVVLRRSERKGSVDYAKVPELKGVDLDNYRKPSSEYWRISAE